MSKENYGPVNPDEPYQVTASAALTKGFDNVDILILDNDNGTYSAVIHSYKDPSHGLANMWSSVGRDFATRSEASDLFEQWLDAYKEMGYVFVTTPDGD